MHKAIHEGKKKNRTNMSFKISGQLVWPHKHDKGKKEKQLRNIFLLWSQYENNLLEINFPRE